MISYGFATPPAILILLCLIGALLAPVWRSGGVGLMLLASLCLYGLATPALSSYLLQAAESGLPANPDLSAAQAIVVLGGDARDGDGTGIPDRLGPYSLERVVFAARAYRQLHLPIVVSGGRVGDARASEAELLKAALEQDFSVPVRWIEDRSRTTIENAFQTARLLRPQQIGTVVVVSQAWHLPRALWSFEQAGLRALPWPAPGAALRLRHIDDFLPSAAALNDSYHALHELIGGAYYRARYG